MINTSPMVEMFRRISSTVTETVSDALGVAAWSDPDDRRPAVVRKAARAWSPVPTMLTQIEGVVSDLEQQVTAVVADPQLSDQGKNTKLRDLAEATSTRLELLSGDVRKAADQVLAALAGALPARPETTAAQETALMGVKADMQMVLAPLQGTEAGRKIVDLVKRAIADRDQLTLWLLATSHWVEDYLSSRGAEDVLPMVRAGIGEALDSSPETADLAEVRRLHARVSHPQQGLPALLLAMQHLVNSELRSLRARVGIPAA